MSRRQGITILGASGSIGQSTLDVVRRHPDRYRVVALTAHRQIERLVADCLEFSPLLAVLGDAGSAAEANRLLREQGSKTEVLHGEAALVAAATLPEADMVMAAIVGAAGLAPTLAAAESGRRILLANKEVLVMAGELFMRAVRAHGAVLLPVDSEHNAIFQALPADFSRGLTAAGVQRILLTASGGPFRNASLADLQSVTPAQACAHPNWSMGRKISVDSATMMNKGLEVIEAHWLFAVPAERIQVVIHPQSVVHSLVQYIDGSVIAELGNPDMRTPIAHALAYPERIAAGVEPLDLFTVANLSFERPDDARFPCLPLAYRALREGGSAPAILNAANEIAVQAFIDREIAFTAIPRVIEKTLDQLPGGTLSSLDDVLAADAAARRVARACIAEMRS